MLLYYFSYFCYIVARISVRIILGKEKRNTIFRKKLITHQTGPKGREVKKLYLEEVNSYSEDYAKTLFTWKKNFLFNYD